MSEKLRKKTDTDASTSSKSIMAIASLLRNGAVEQASAYSDGQTENENQTVDDSSDDFKQVNNESDSMSLEELVKVIKAKEYTCKDVIYVDSELKEIFSLLKAKLKIPISPLVSYIIEDWVSKHEKQIIDLINSKKNRFL
ncbi:hypothetical protein Bacsa_3686 (plasmid) [Phocaeicola salanitronis DSM 18170]|uniref:Uncharacterized protein n=1 Tax=Phocaeicola salanitronis (strain DSM 18170 / JCM 13657 / CCUG 60908 / BL78) TaxID=667015 RepID=F0R986_PHOSB|nr:hypothetical protein [Phocaeicola salanitronis]ADY38207.1 hypothetical protein Bacsa_3686 [Phocaeicola salanitronis DSM 18170]